MLETCQVTVDVCMRRIISKLTFARDEGDELGHAFLHAFLRLLRNLCVLGQSGFHNSGDWSKVANVSIRLAIAILVVCRRQAVLLLLLLLALQLLLRGR